MAITYTNRKGQTYTLYQGQTKTGKPRSYFARTDKNNEEPVAELPAGFTISESVNGVVSLVKDHPALILPEEVAAVVEAIEQHPQARRYRIAVKHNGIEVYEQAGPDYKEVARVFQPTGHFDPGLAERLQSEMERNAQYTPIMRFDLLDPVQRRFGVQRMCYRSSIDGWLELAKMGSIATLAHALIPTLGTDEFFELL